MYIIFHLKHSKNKKKKHKCSCGSVDGNTDDFLFCRIELASLPKCPRSGHHTTQNFSYYCATNSATAIPEYFASGGKNKIL